MIPKTLLEKLLPGLGIAFACALLLFVGHWWGSSSQNTAWSLKWAQRDKDDADARIAFTEQQDRITAQRQGDIDAIQKKAQSDIAAAQHNVAVARAESDRLQSGVSAAIAQLRAGGSDTGTAVVRAARDKTGLLLAELYREIDTAAGEYAEEADRAYATGLRCEAAFDAVRSRR